MKERTTQSIGASLVVHVYLSKLTLVLIDYDKAAIYQFLINLSEGCLRLTPASASKSGLSLTEKHECRLIEWCLQLTERIDDEDLMSYKHFIKRNLLAIQALFSTAI